MGSGAVKTNKTRKINKYCKQIEHEFLVDMMRRMHGGVEQIKQITNKQINSDKCIKKKKINGIKMQIILMEFMCGVSK